MLTLLFSVCRCLFVENNLLSSNCCAHPLEPKQLGWTSYFIVLSLFCSDWCSVQFVFPRLFTGLPCSVCLLCWLWAQIVKIYIIHKEHSFPKPFICVKLLLLLCYVIWPIIVIQAMVIQAMVIQAMLSWRSRDRRNCWDRCGRWDR